MTAILTEAIRKCNAGTIGADALEEIVAVIIKFSEIDHFAVSYDSHGNARLIHNGNIIYA